MTSRQKEVLDQQQQENVTQDQTGSDKVTLPSFQIEELGCFSWLKPQVNRLEIRSALNMSINTTPFWIGTFPDIINLIACFWCAQFQADCSVLSSLNPYLRYMFLLHVIYNPAMYMLTSIEFLRAFKRVVRKCYTINP